MAVLLSSFHVVQLFLGAYSGLLSYSSIVRLQKYEKPSEKGAKYSSTVDHELHKTRTTQTSGVVAVCIHLQYIIPSFRPSNDDRRRIERTLIRPLDHLFLCFLCLSPFDETSRLYPSNSLLRQYHWIGSCSDTHQQFLDRQSKGSFCERLS